MRVSSVSTVESLETLSRAFRKQDCVSAYDEGIATFLLCRETQSRVSFNARLFQPARDVRDPCDIDVGTDPTEVCFPQHLNPSLSPLLFMTREWTSVIEHPNKQVNIHAHVREGSDQREQA
jgi:hypothetical protein